MFSPVAACMLPRNVCLSPALIWQPLCRDPYRRHRQIKGVTADWPTASRRWRVSFSQVIMRVQPGLGLLLLRLLPPQGSVWLLNSELRTIIGSMLVSKETSHRASLSLSVSLAHSLFSLVEILAPSTSADGKHERSGTISPACGHMTSLETAAELWFLKLLFFFKIPQWMSESLSLSYKVATWKSWHYVINKLLSNDGNISDPHWGVWFNSKWKQLNGISIELLAGRRYYKISALKPPTPSSALTCRRYGSGTESNILANNHFEMCWPML